MSKTIVKSGSSEAKFTFTTSHSLSRVEGYLLEVHHRYLGDHSYITVVLGDGENKYTVFNTGSPVLVASIEVVENQLPVYGRFKRGGDRRYHFVPMN